MHKLWLDELFIVHTGKKKLALRLELLRELLVDTLAQREERLQVPL